MSNPIITIAIPTYNNEKTLRATIESCLNQNTDIDYEIFISNNASIDGTAAVIAEYKNDKIRVLTQKNPVSLYRNHNLCFENALGDYILFCHSDDMLEEHAIEFFMDKLEKRNYPKKYIVWGHSMFRDFSKKTNQIDDFSYNTIVAGEYAPRLFFYGGLTPCGTLFSRQDFVDIGAYIEPGKNSSPSDLTSMIRAAMKGFKFEMVDEMLFYRESPSTALVHDNVVEYLNEIDDAFVSYIEKTSMKDLKKLITLSVGLKNKPLNFLYAMSQVKELHPQIRRIILKELMLNPLKLRDPVLRKVLKRVI